MSKQRFNRTIVAQAYQAKRGTVVAESALGVKYLATAIYDTAANDSAGVSNKTIAAHGLGVYLPIKAIITDVYYDVITTFTSASDAGTLALMVQGAGDAVAAIAISDASNVWDAGIHGSILGYPNLGADAAHDTALEVAALFAGSMLKLTAERELTITVAVEALTAGKLVVFVEYVLSA
jgi:hypothetical protein